MDFNATRLNSLKTGSITKLLQIAVLVCVILYFGRMVFIPLGFALLISFILYPICQWMENRGVSSVISITFSMFSLLIIFLAIGFLFAIQVKGFLGEWQNFKGSLFHSLDKVGDFVSEKLNISQSQQKMFLKDLGNNTSSQVIPFLRITAWSLSVTTVLAVLIPVFSALILYHRKVIVNTLYSFFSLQDKEAVHAVLVESVHAYYNFIKGMIVVYIIVGILNSIGLAIIGVPHPVMFGFIASVLTFIPYVGIMIASLLPITISWVTYDSILYPLGVVLVFSFVQLLEAYVIFPMAVGSRLKINTLMMLIAILVGGVLWGAAGMILFIPFLSILKLIADRTESFKVLSIILSTDK